VHWQLLTPHEAAAAALFVQHNAKWVDRRLSTALAWRLLNARIDADLAADGRQMSQGRQLQHQQPAAQAADSTSGTSSSSSAADAGSASGRQARQRTLLYGLDTAWLEAWTGNTMFCTARRIPCSWQLQQQTPQQGHQQGQRQAAARQATARQAGDLLPASWRPMALQLEREDPRHAAAEAVSGTSSGGGGATGGGGSGWDLQVSLDPETFPTGFQGGWVGAGLCVSWQAACCSTEAWLMSVPPGAVSR
jgi:hypothetical protein